MTNKILYMLDGNKLKFFDKEGDSIDGLHDDDFECDQRFIDLITLWEKEKLQEVRNKFPNDVFIDSEDFEDE